MKTLKRNQQSFWYSLYEGVQSLKDELGNITGEYVPTYSKPKMAWGNISANKGDTTINVFGSEENYDRVIVLSDKESLIDEYSILWVDDTPVISVEGEVISSHNYIVTKVAKSLNSKLIAIEKVNVNA